MADIYASAAAAAVARPKEKVRADLAHGNIRLFHSVYVAPPAASPAIADRIIWGTLPIGARLLGHLGEVQFNAGTASCTINLGDNILPARHAVATAVTSAGSFIPQVADTVKACVVNITTGSNMLTAVRGMGCFTVGDLVVGAGIPLGSRVVAVDTINRMVQISAVATATTADLATTVTGASFVTTRASANDGNGYTDAFDDCTLISVVAGAIIAVNQVLSLKMPYVMD